MRRLGLERDIVDEVVRGRALDRCRSLGVRLPTFAQLADPDTIPADITERLAGLDPDAPDPLNLFRVHWFNDASRAGRAPVPVHLVLPESLTGVPSP
ncbi:MAG: cysteine synthase, partial [Chloroflexota bacterium]|nr:cysteine synthase [Chloroflexota bacterium]